MNDSVTATGMSVKAEVSSSLVIKGQTNSEDDDYTGTGTNVISKTAMKPCTSFDGIYFGALASSVDVENAHSAKATWSGASGAFTASDLTIAADLHETIEDSNYVAVSKYSIKNVGESADVYVSSITVTGGNATYKDSMRIAVKLGDNGVILFNVGGGSNLTEGVGKYNTQTSTWSLATNPSYITAGNKAAKLGSLTADTPLDLYVLIWFEGQDTSCYSEAYDATAFSIDINFTNVQPTE